MRDNYSRKKKNVWQMQQAKAKFSQFVENVNVKRYQTIIKQGEPVTVILVKNEFDKIIQSKTSFLDFFKAAPCQEFELTLQRSKDLSREFD